VPATLRDAEYFLQQEARQHGAQVEGYPRLAEEVEKLAPHVDAVLLTQFSMAAALSHLRDIASVPVLSAPHSSARRLKELLSAS
jgi:hypothetical protein